MKKIKVILLTTVTLAMVGLQTSCTDYQDEIDALDFRVTVLENLVKETNSQLEALQIAVSAFANGDYITSITENNEGYIINFSKADPIFVRHGKDGKDGTDGKDGKDAQMPEISVKQDIDGNFYWVVDGEWITDSQGNKVRAHGKDGKDGRDGNDGKDGNDGISPKVRINEEGIWEVSTDGGLTWVSTGTSCKGQDGRNGADANSILRVVTHWNEGYVEFITASGSFIVPLYSGNN